MTRGVSHDRCERCDQVAQGPVQVVLVAEGDAGAVGSDGKGAADREVTGRGEIEEGVARGSPLTIVVQVLQV